MCVCVCVCLCVFVHVCVRVCVSVCVIHLAIMICDDEKISELLLMRIIEICIKKSLSK